MLVVHGDLAPRLALQTILRAGGYAVDVSATPAEALSKLDENEYQLVLADAEIGPQRSVRDILAYARVKEYHPATALITDYAAQATYSADQNGLVAIHTENLPHLLEKVAELIGIRASRRYRPLRQAV